MVIVIAFKVFFFCFINIAMLHKHSHIYISFVKRLSLSLIPFVSFLYAIFTRPVPLPALRSRFTVVNRYALRQPLPVLLGYSVVFIASVTRCCSWCSCIARCLVLRTRTVRCLAARSIGFGLNFIWTNPLTAFESLERRLIYSVNHNASRILNATADSNSILRQFRLAWREASKERKEKMFSSI